MNFLSVGSARRPVMISPQANPTHQNVADMQASVYFGADAYNRLPKPIHMIPIVPPLPGIDVVVGMNDQKPVPANKSGGTHSLGGCTSIDVVYQDNTKFVTHYDSLSVTPHINLIKGKLPNAKALLIYTPENPRNPGVPKEPRYESELKTKFPGVITVAYDKNLQPGQKGTLTFTPNGNQTRIADGRGLINMDV